MAAGTLGMRGSGSFAADERPKNWRQMILLMFPNGDTPLTAILSKLAEEPTDDPEFSWFEKGLPTYRATVTGANASEGSRPTTSIAASGSDFDVALALQPDGGSADDYTWLKVGNTLYNENTEELLLVTFINQTGTPTNNYINVHRDIGNKFGSGNLPAITIGHFMSVVGSAYQEGAPVGQAVSFAPVRFTNYTQIFRTPLMLTRTARRTKLRWDKTGPYMEAKREALQIHATEMERAFLFGVDQELSAITAGMAPITGSTNPTSSANPLRTTRGIVNWLPAITSGASPTVHYDVNTANSGIVTEQIMDAWLEEVFRFGSPEKLCLAGSTALNMLNQLAKGKMTITAVPSDRAYGMSLNRYITPFGDLLVKQHPLLSHNPTWRKDLLVVDTAYLRVRVLDETAFLRNRQNPGDDASIDEFLTEVGLECRFSGRAGNTGGGLSSNTTAAVHGRLKGISAVG